MFAVTVRPTTAAGAPIAGDADYHLRGAIAQLGERLHGMQEVGGSSPPGSTGATAPGERRDRAVARGLRRGCADRLADVMAAGRSGRLVGAVAIALIAAYAVVWAQVSTLNIGCSDFTSTYVGGTLLPDGQRAHLYDEAAQQKLHARLILPDAEGNLPFVDAPVAAALAAPVTLLDLRSAYRVWSVLQPAVLTAAIVIAVRSAPWRPDTPRSWKVAAGAAALA